MTNPTLRRRRPGFTLIELLVVITIIAILAAAGFAAGNSMMLRARKTTALNVATSLEQALNNFHNEYGYLPSEDTDDTVVKTDESDGVEILVILSGREEDSDEMLNTKSINYLTVKEGKKSGTRGRDGIIFNDAGEPLGIYDPWGGPFLMALDLSGDDKLDFSSLPSKPKAHSTRVLNGRRAAVWSDGSDWKDAGGGTATDDVVTW